MNTYEFWNEMDKIYDAIVAYQEKTIEFNKRFINPWVKLGNIFDKQESKESIVAHKNAVEIDPENAQNWYELASACTRSGDFEKSIQAYQKAIELGFESGELYKNLALAYTMTARHQESIPVFQRALDLSESNEDKAVVWNHLGNVYRKLNNYELALQAFQHADQFEIAITTIAQDPPAREVDEEIAEVAVAQADELSASQTTDEPAPIMDSVPTLEEADLDEVGDVIFDNASLEVDQAGDFREEESVSAPAMPVVDEVELSISEECKSGEEDDEFDNDMPVVLEVDFSIDSSTSQLEETITEEAEEGFSEEEPFTKCLAISEEGEGLVAIENTQDEPKAEEVAPEEASVEEFLAESEEAGTTSLETTQGEPDALEAATEETPVAEFLAALAEREVDDEDVDFVDMDDENDEEDLDAALNPTAVTLAEEWPDEKVLEESLEASEIEKGVELTLNNDSTPTLSVYEEYLEENSNPINVNLTESQSDENQSIAMVPADVGVTNSEISMEVNTDLTADMDTKNAHVWNELGNVYFNAGSFDDAIAAYSKAIELDKQFAWPYTNLAMAFVQKGRLAESVLLYQRSIELFSNEKDKAVTWNRLGDVYRRLNDYENAIAAYQRADELDPGNIAMIHQSRFSLLGSEKVDQEAGYSL